MFIIRIPDGRSHKKLGEGYIHTYVCLKTVAAFLVVAVGVMERMNNGRRRMKERNEKGKKRQKEKEDYKQK